MTARWVAAAATAVLSLAACTGGGTIDGVPSARGTGGGKGTGSAPSGTPAKAKVVTAFAPAWSWTPPHGTGADRRTASITQDATHVFVASTAGTGRSLAASRSWVTSLDRDTGKQLWQIPFSGEVANLKLVSGVLVLTQSRSTGPRTTVVSLQGLDPSSGKRTWRYTAPFEVPEEGTLAVVGSSVYVDVRVSSVRSYVHRIDARTGKSTAQIRSTSFEAPLVGDGLILLDNAGVGLSAVTPDLRRYAYRIRLDDHRLTADRVVDGVLVRIDARPHADVVYGHDPRTGRRLWRARLSWGDDPRRYSSTPSQVVVASGSAAVAVDARTGRTSWRVPTIIENELAPATADDENLLVCGRSLISVDGRTGRAYGAARLPSDGYEDGCDLPPDAASDLVVVGSGTSVDAYRLTTSTDATATSGDGTGAWGPADPALCGVDATRSRAALAGALGGTWRLYAAVRSGGRKGTCAFSRGRTYADVVPLTRARAHAYFGRHNEDSVCGDFGADRGSRHRVSAAGTGLPAGSGGCYQTGLVYGGYKASDPVGGVTRTKDGQWLEVSYDVAHGTAARTHQPARLIELLGRFAR